MRVWNIATGRPIGEPIHNHDGAVTQCGVQSRWHPDRRGRSDHTVRVVGQRQQADQIGEPLRGHEDWVTSVAFSPDGTRIASGGWDKTMRLWDTATGDQAGEPLRGEGGVGPTKGITGVCVQSRRHPDRLGQLGQHGATVGQRNSTPNREPPLRGSPVTSVAFSPDGTRIASGNSDNTVRLWDAATGSPIGALSGHDAAVQSVAFISDMRVVSSGDDGSVRVWDTTWQPLHRPHRASGECPVLRGRPQYRLGKR